MRKAVEFRINTSVLTYYEKLFVHITSISSPCVQLYKIVCAQAQAHISGKRWPSHWETLEKKVRMVIDKIYLCILGWVCASLFII